jgi:diguanylate cyclase (GGDEF)-like protein/PAS domain S-box-containing protein
MTSTYANRNDRLSALPPIADLLRVTLLLAILSTAASALNLDSWRSGGVTILWPSNGFLLGVLLCSPRRHWPSYLTIGFVVDLGINIYLSHIITGHTGFSSEYLSTCNMLEVYLAAQFLYKTISPDPDLTKRRQLFALLAYGVVLVPALISLLASIGITGGFTSPNLHSFQEWFTADGLGVAIVTPLYLSYHRREHFPDRSWIEIAGLFALLCAITYFIFWQTRLPLFFLVMPFLLIMGTRLRLAGSALGLLIVCIIGGFLTTADHGPASLVPGASISQRALMLQFFVAVSMLVLYIIEVIKAESSHLQLNLLRSENRFRLLAEVSRDVIVLTDLDGNRRYVSPAATEVLGWTPEELLGHDYHQIVHPDDIPSLEKIIRECRDGRPYNILSYRCRKKDGSWLWMEANLRLYRDSATNEPVGFVNVVRDIAARKAAEEDLNRAVHLAELLATVDGLTGIANRRRLDEVLDHEWRRAMRDHSSISLLMIDVDNFKSFNDLYGHLQGDTCLRQIASAAGARIQRTTDLLARFGGEEFVVVLPNTDSPGASTIAEEIRRSIFNLCLPHEGNPHRCITVSIGCATVAPEIDSSSDILYAAADKALYRAKEAGRNCVECADHVNA